MLDTHARKYVEPMIGRTAHLLLVRGFTPNQVTWAAFLIGILTGGFIYLDKPIFAVILLWLSGYLDAVDGSMARKKKSATPWGTVMDITFDRLVELSVIIGLGAKYPDAQFVLLLLTGAIVFSMTVFLTVGALSDKKGIKSFYYQAGLAERTEGFILFSIMVLFSSHLVLLTLLFLFVEIFTALQRLAEAKRILST
jgi:archaetidylinositol phosphate synthase